MNRRHVIITLAVVGAALIGFQVGNRETRQIVPDVEVRPLIGIASVTDENYIRAVREAGGVPVILPTGGGSGAIESYLLRLDGLLMPGGLDIPPVEYGEEAHETVVPLEEDRYRFEKNLGKAWIEDSDKPLLGICLGGQWINVLHGGSLVQDIPSATGGDHRGTSHQVTLEKDSRLARIFGETEFEVNSNHHQAVKDLGEGLRIVARSPDGLPEAIEGTDPLRFLVGVQWHPERMAAEDERQRRLFAAFVEAAGR